MTDFSSIIQKPGYRREDLSKESQEILANCDSMIAEAENLKENLEFLDDPDLSIYGKEDLSIIGKMKQEIVLKTIDAVVEWLQMHVDEIQVALAESEANE